MAVQMQTNRQGEALSVSGGTSLRLAVIDGQGGGIGKALVEKLRQRLVSQVHILALGTNALATSAMLRAGADEGATGENAIVRNASRVEVIVGPIGIVVANAMLGELTPAMACAVGESAAMKFLIPVSRCSVQIAGCETRALPQSVEQVVDMVEAYRTRWELPEGGHGHA
jgi:NAD(P)-dependent dehydrogenase (short-subunit alcohol dehydrogenase family)